ncbi:extracellular solute-binding protein [Streptomyces armeniacus]|uniref:Extracellular solute-binding protein n=1 Tax=Streptomyces armeniacus TaxID=83291 RepID=A0A345XND3_9ACTN|nr:extracellular solute-binding protein [Streptomyces armeniacus]AXK33149.1 extracellular solute-binding protein [Streptomyces armeniacus]
MRVSARIAAPVVALALAGLTATACAPSTDDGGAEKDEKSGTLRVWLFKEVNNKPKQDVVNDVVAKFQKSHEDVKVDVQYIPVDSRAEKIKGALNDPDSAPDVIEFGNTDTAGYVADGGLADVTEEFGAWDEGKDTDPTAKESVTVDGKIYGAPLFVGVRALYYRTDVFKDLGLKPPKTLAEVASTARKIRQERPELYGLMVGGAYTYGAMPFIWAHGGELATEKGGDFTAAINSDKAQKGIKAYTDLFGKDNCPPSNCAQMTGNDNVEAFASGKAGMALGGDFNRQAMDDGSVKGKYAVVPLPGLKEGDIAPGFAGGNNVGVMKSTSHRTLAVDLMQQLAGKETQQRLFEEMGFLPTFGDTRKKAAAEEPFVEPFVRTLESGAKFVPASPAWAEIDAGMVLPTMFQQIASGKKDVAGASDAAAQQMDEAFAK